MHDLVILYYTEVILF